MSTAQHICLGCQQQAFLLRKSFIKDVVKPYTMYVYSCDRNCPEEEIQRAMEEYRSYAICTKCRELHVTLCSRE